MKVSNAFAAFVSVLAILVLNACGNNSSKTSSEDTVSESVSDESSDDNTYTIGKWQSLEGQIESTVTLSYNKSEHVFYVHDEMKNPSSVLYDSTKPVALSSSDGHVYEITYVQKWDDHYKLDSKSGTLFWYCKDYNDVKMTTNLYYMDKLNASIKDKEAQ